MNAFEKVQAICAERDGLRNEINLYQKNIYKCIFALMAATATVVATSPDLNLIPKLKDWRIFAVLAQLVVVFGALIGLLFTGQSITAGYIAALEERINKYSGEVVTAWESKVAPKAFKDWRNPWIWCEVLLGIIITLGITLLLVIIGWQHEKKAYAVGVGVEYVVVCISYLVAGLFTKQYTRRLACKVLAGETEDKANNSQEGNSAPGKIP
ncbi:MAG: hypothetical protein JSV38_14715 [Desulfobacterales bacterium]|nr:MAG: hypothetical protein JSV38_14715 [Desulfobacterales bacterium]